MTESSSARAAKRMIGGMGRADLIVALAAISPERDTDAARLLGFDERPDDASVDEPRAADSPARESEAALTDPAKQKSQTSNPLEGEAKPKTRKHRPVPLWRVVAAEEYDEPPTPIADMGLQPLAPHELKRRGGPLPALDPLAPWSRLGPRLHRALNVGVRGRSVDVPALVARVARGELVRDVPRRVRRAWPQRAVVLIDRATRLIPFWTDQAAVCEQLKRACGARALEFRVLLEGPGGRVLASRDGRAVDPRRIPVGEPVLALSDLGCYDEDLAVTRAWHRLARELRRAGCFPRSLVPAPAPRWRAAVARSWGARAWERERGRGVAHDELQLRDRVERLLRLVSPAVRVEPGLLRAIRRLLPRDEADAGTEADAWNNPAILGEHAAAMGFEDPVVRAAYRNGFSSEVALHEEIAEVLVAALARWHAALSPAVRAEEVLTLAALTAEREGAPLVDAVEVAWAQRYIQRMPRTLTGGENELPRARQASVSGFVGRLVQRVPAGLFSNDELGDALVRMWHHVHGDKPGAALPPGVTPERLARVVGSPGPPRPYVIRQEGHELVATPGARSWPVVRGEPGSPLTRITAARGELAVGSSSPWTPVLALSGATARAPLPPGATLHLRTDRSARILAPAIKPSWATEVGRDAYGLWATLTIADARQRFRWIPPGRFLMGSPAGEQGRYDWEGPRHQVAITRGFWLGDTPCTQAMWWALRGDNPSRFKSPQRPVEQLSWDEVDTQLQRLSMAMGRDEDGLFRLPNEAEWEYACRAGTTTSTYAGELEIIGENNAPLLDDIAWYGGNSGVDFDLDNGFDSSDWPKKQHEHTRAGTREAAQKAPNHWGLYDMLGNVWEWCADGWQPDAYSRRRSEEDPVVAADGGDYRVVRGGSWRSDARFVRAAYRSRLHREDRRDFLGFRLARGQELRSAGGEQESS